MLDLIFEEHEGGSELLPRHWVLEALWGTPGGVQYRHLEFEWNSRSRALVARSSKTNEIVGMHLWLSFPWGFLRHMIIVPPPHQRKGVAHALMAEGRRHFGEKLQPGQIIAGIIDSTHSVSRRLSQEAGYEIHRQFDILTFTRRFPSPSSSVRRATPEEVRDILIPRMAAERRGWDDFTTQANEHNTWIILKKDGTIAASATVVRHRMALHSLGLRWLDNLFLPAMRLLMKGAIATDYPFATLHHLWGTPELYSVLWESILAYTGSASAIIAVDTIDPVYAGIKKHVHMGAMGAAVGVIPWLVTASGPIPSDQPIVWPSENR